MGWMIIPALLLLVVLFAYCLAPSTNAGKEPTQLPPAADPRE